MKLLSLSIPNALGTPVPINGPGGIPTGGIDSLSKILQLGYSLVIVIGILFCLYVLIMSGRQYVMSGGDKQKMEKIRNRLSYAIVGLVIIFLSYFIISVLTNFLGFSIK